MSTRRTRTLSTEEIASAQLEYDFAEAKQALLRELIASADLAMPRLPAATGIVDSLERFAGRFVLRWWFARVTKNRAELAKWQADREVQKDTETRRRVRAQTLGAVAAMANRLANGDGGKPPGNQALQVTVLGLASEIFAIWQALVDAAIITPQAKQDYLDAGVSDLYQRMCAFGGRLDLDSKEIPS